MLLISLLSFACMVFHLLIQRNPASPGVVHGAVWLLVSLGYVFFLGDLSILSPRTLVVMLIGIATFSIGIRLGTRIATPGQSRNDHAAKPLPIPPAIVVVSAIGLAMMLYKAFQYMPIDWATSWFDGAGSWYNGLRHNLNNSQAKGSFGLAGYALNFSFAGTAYLVLFARRYSPTLWLWASIVLSLGFAFLSTGKTHLVLLGCMVVGAAMPSGRSKRLLLVLALPLLGGAILFLVTLLTGRLITTPHNSLLASVEQTIKVYMFTAVGAFDISVNSGLPSTEGSMTFRTPLAVLRFLGAPVEVPEMIQPNVTFASYLINVYTVFSPYYRDFGVVGVGLFLGVLGALHGWIFRQLKTGMPIIIVANALLFYALIMQFFQDQYFSLMSQWIQLLGWTYVFNKLQPLPSIAEQDRQ